jgi:hypothetical protein
VDGTCRLGTWRRAPATHPISGPGQLELVSQAVAALGEVCDGELEAMAVQASLQHEGKDGGMGQQPSGTLHDAMGVDVHLACGT